MHSSGIQETKAHAIEDETTVFADIAEKLDVSRRPVLTEAWDFRFCVLPGRSKNSCTVSSAIETVAVFESLRHVKGIVEVHPMPMHPALPWESRVQTSP